MHRGRQEKRRRPTVAELRRIAGSSFAPVPGVRKLSESLVEFAAPLLETISEPSHPEEVREVLLIAATIWNIVVLSENRKVMPRPEAMQARKELVDRLEPDVHQRVELEALVADLVQRKRVLFGEDERFIMDVQTYDRGDEVRVIVAGSLEP